MRARVSSDIQLARTLASVSAPASIAVRTSQVQLLLGGGVRSWGVLAEFARDRDRPGDEVGGRDDLVDPSACRRGGDVDAPPTPRQFVRLLMRPGIEEAERLALKRCPRVPAQSDLHRRDARGFDALPDARRWATRRRGALLGRVKGDAIGRPSFVRRTQ